VWHYLYHCEHRWSQPWNGFLDFLVLREWKRLAAAAAEGIARQPEAADKITGAINLPLFLLEGVAVIGEVFALLIVLMK